MMLRVALITATCLFMSSPVLAQTPMLEPLAGDETDDLSIDEKLRRCSGYFAAAWRYTSEVAEPTLMTDFVKGAVWRAEDITLRLTDPNSHNEARAAIQSYSDAYFVQFRNMPPRIDPNRIDDQTALYFSDGDACHDVMFDAAEGIEGLQ